MAWTDIFLSFCQQKLHIGNLNAYKTLFDVKFSLTLCSIVFSAPYQLQISYKTCKKTCKKLLCKVRPLPKSVFRLHDPTGLAYLTQLRVGLSKLNFHKFKHNFRDTINPMCPTNDGIEDTEHFLLLCPSFEAPRRDLLAGVSALLRPLGHTNLSNEFLMQILLYGDKDFPNNLNKDILLLTLRFIHETGRFN